MEIAFIYALAAICTRITPLELEVAEHVMALTQTDRPAETTHWTAAMMAKDVGHQRQFGSAQLAFAWAPAAHGTPLCSCPWLRRSRNWVWISAAKQIRQSQGNTGGLDRYRECVTCLGSCIDQLKRSSGANFRPTRHHGNGKLRSKRRSAS